MTCQILRIDGLESREDDPWDVFIADDDELDPEPQPGDFWTDDDLPFTDARHVSDPAQACERGVLLCSP